MTSFLSGLFGSGGLSLLGLGLSSVSYLIYSLIDSITVYFVLVTVSFTPHTFVAILFKI